MNKGIFALTILGAFTMASCATATVLSYQVLDGSTVIGSGSSTSGAIVLSGSDSNFTLVSGVASSSPILASPNFSTNNFSLTANGLASPATLTIRVTSTGLASFSGRVTNAFTLNSLTAASTFVSGTIANYFDASNTAYGTGTLLGSATFTGTDSFSTQNSTNTTMAGIFSETTIYTLNFKAGGASSLSSSSQLTGAVPEPATWTMMLLGFGVLGYGMRRWPKAAARIDVA